jgi:hypothetical protein
MGTSSPETPRPVRWLRRRLLFSFRIKNENLVRDILFYGNLGILILYDKGRCLLMNLDVGAGDNSKMTELVHPGV